MLYIFFFPILILIILYISYTDHDSTINWQDLHVNKFFSGGVGDRFSSNIGRIGCTPFFMGIRIELILGEKLI